jgi:hypothetical protein
MILREKRPIIRQETRGLGSARLFPCRQERRGAPGSMAQVECKLMSARAGREGDTARFADIIEADLRFEVHPAGHTKKLLRYRSLASHEPLVIEKRKGPPVVYVSHESTKAFGYAFSNARRLPAGKTQRNSNLAAAFGERELTAIKPEHDVDFLAAVGCVV